MYALLSPAKRLHTIKDPPAVQSPAFWSESRIVANELRTMNEEQISSLMKISAKLGKLNHARFQSLSMEAILGTPAIHTFAGDTYKGLQAESLSQEDIFWAQDRVGILSGFYGILRPLDSIEPYRLEMGTRLKVGENKDLYAFWNKKVISEVALRLQKIQSKTIINLASVEYFSVLKGHSFHVINPIFKERKNGVDKVIALMAKRARGAMARYIIKHRLSDIEALKEFDQDGYGYCAEQSDEQNWVFRR